MKDTVPLYNSRIAKIYLDYIKRYYPDVDTDSILLHAEMAKHEVGDPGHWFTQRQVNRFNEILVEKTGNPNISREAGRYAASSEALGAIKKYMLGLINLTAIYLFMTKIYSFFSRAAITTTKKIGPATVEIVSLPQPGVTEREFQCKNRMGMFEATAKLFTGKFAEIEHPACLHKGDVNCRYVIHWKEPTFLVWKRIFHCFVLMSVVFAFSLYFVLPFADWSLLVLVCTFFVMMILLYHQHLERKELSSIIETQGDVAKELVDEINIRYSNALLIQEIGQATSKMFHVDTLVNTVVSIMEKRLYFDRGLIMLADKEKKKLMYSAGYGYTREQEAFLKENEFNLNNPDSRGTLVQSFREQKPFLINDIEETEKNFSIRSRKVARAMGVKSFISVPIVYKTESIGVLVVDNIQSKKFLTQSDLSFLTGVALQVAVSIMNAVSFQKITESEKKYRELVENANSIILRVDIDGKIIFFNEFAQKFFGYTEDEILGENVAGKIFPDVESVKHDFDKRLAFPPEDTEQYAASENEKVLKDGRTVWIAWTYKPIFNSDGNFKEILCIGNDITKLKHAEQEKKELSLRLQRSQKMEAIGMLAGGVAHDLNNILSGLVSYPDLLLMGLPDDSPMRKPILTIQNSGEKAASIVQDMLTLARRGVAVMDVVNINDVIMEYLNSPEHENLMTGHRDVLIRKKIERNLLNMSGSRIHLSKTVMNLVFNAVEAMPEGGIISISTENRYIDQAINGYDEVREGDYVTVSISDTGVGILPKDMERIFEPFYTKKVMGKSGTGLGMAVVWGTVKDHEGYIDVRSSKGEGTTFTLYFPVVREELSADKTTLHPIKDCMGKGESILVVDDVEEQREIASGMLKKLGYSATSVASGEGAVDYLKTNTVDLIVLDMIMVPGMDGLDTYKEILKMHAGQKAIITSGFSETARIKEAKRLGVQFYIKKPYLIETFGRAVRDALDG